MTRNLRKGQKKRKLSIPPIEIPGKIAKVPVSAINVIGGKVLGRSYSEAVVAYLDILGFSEKRDDEDIESCLRDFSGALIIAANYCPKVRVNMFSDCAFVAIPIENAADLLAAIRFAFTQWVSDGLLVRGGIATGTYSETYSFALAIAAKNFTGSLFSGSAVTAAVKLEGSGDGALLFTNGKCAEFYHSKYGEPIFTLGNDYIIGWSDEESPLFWFAGISLLQLLKCLSSKDETRHPVIGKLLNNLRYSFHATAQSLFIWSLALALLCLPTITPEVRQRAVGLLEIKDPDDFSRIKPLIDVWLNNKKREIELLKALADMDSSIPVSKK
jgi:hypothetical protein